MRKNRIILLSLVFILSAGMYFSPFVYADIGYFREIADRKVTTINDGCKVITMFLRLDKEYPDFNSQFQMLKYKGIVPYNLEAQPDVPLRKGVLAYMVAKALGIKGGVIMRLFGVSQRYALKECVFLDLMMEENAREIVEGKELIGVLLRMEKYQEERGK